MAQTTTAKNACNAVIKIDNDSAVLTDVSGSSNNVSVNMSNNVGEFKSFGSTYKGSLDCGKDVTISIDAIYSTTVDEARDILENWFENGGTRTVQIDVPSSAAGNRRYAGEFILESLSMQLASDEAGPVMVTAELKVNGSFDISTIS